MEWPYRWPPDIAVGWWYTVCCRADLYQITGAEELDEIRADFDEDREEGWLGQWWHFWPSEEAALADGFLAEPDPTR